MSQDQNFKNLILGYPRAALALFAAAEAVDLDPGVRVVPIRQEQLQARLGERFRELDVPLLAEWPDGRRATLLLVLEEESGPRRFSIHRLVHYCLDLAELFGTDRVVPVVIFLRAAVGVAEQLRLGAYRHPYLHLRYLRCARGELSPTPTTATAWWPASRCPACMILAIRVLSAGRLDDVLHCRREHPVRDAPQSAKAMRPRLGVRGEATDVSMMRQYSHAAAPRTPVV